MTKFEQLNIERRKQKMIQIIFSMVGRQNCSKKYLNKLENVNDYFKLQTIISEIMKKQNIDQQYIEKGLQKLQNIQVHYLSWLLTCKQQLNKQQMTLAQEQLINIYNSYDLVKQGQKYLSIHFGKKLININKDAIMQINKQRKNKAKQILVHFKGQRLKKQNSNKSIIQPIKIPNLIISKEKQKIRGQRSLLQKDGLLKQKIKTYSKIFDVKLQERSISGLTNFVHETFRKFMKNTIQKMIKISLVQNRRHEKFGNEFDVFKKVDTNNQNNITQLLPFYWEKDYCYQRPRKQRKKQMEIIQINNNLNAYDYLKRNQNLQQKNLIEDFLNKRLKSQDEIDQLFLKDCKGIILSQNIDQKKIKGLTIFQQKRSAKRLTINVEIVQYWLQQSKMNILLQKSYFK